jgi:hypothetical protein
VAQPPARRQGRREGCRDGETKAALNSAQNSPNPLCFATTEAARMSESGDRIYALVIGERAVLAFPAHSFREAQSLLKEAWLLDDLRALQSAGAPVWDGKTKPVVRAAQPAEIDQFARGSKDHSGDDLPIVYLVE